MPMHDPSHPGLMVRDSVEAVGWTVTETAEHLGVARNSLSRLLNGRVGISPQMALALERLGWSNASHWMRYRQPTIWHVLGVKRKQRRNDGTPQQLNKPRVHVDTAGMAWIESPGILRLPCR